MDMRWARWARLARRTRWASQVWANRGDSGASAARDGSATPDGRAIHEPAADSWRTSDRFATTKATRRHWRTAGVTMALAALLTGCGTNPVASGVAPSGTAPSPHKHPSIANTAYNPGPSAHWRAQRWPHAPAMTIDPADTYIATVKTTYGTLTMQLFAKLAPVTVNSFVFLARHHFYDGDKFFRIIRPYMVQTGDPLQNGTGGPGYQFDDELPVHYSYKPGIVAMANSGPNTDGSQFFICTGPEAAQILDAQPNYTQFARVISGMSVLQRIAAVPVGLNVQLQEDSKPLKDVYIESITVTRER